ncbi:MAG: hypothetical protein P4L49_08360 [Desulfosporosinus sp.]|nr:hypothetical protein [Desulfosporosinus sp.]
MNIKKLGIIAGFLLVVGIGFYNYYYISTYRPPDQYINNPFMIDDSKFTIEEAAPKLVNTKQDYYFDLINASDKPVKLIDIKLSDYSGIDVGKLTYNGRALNGLDLPSDRVYDSDGWQTKKGLEIHYNVTIKEEKIINPKVATITYSSSGVIHKQDVKLP